MHLAAVARHRCKARCTCNRVFAQQTGFVGLKKLNGTVETTAADFVVNTQIQHSVRLPRKGRVGNIPQLDARLIVVTRCRVKGGILKVANLYKIDGILSKVEERGIEYTNIGRVDHSQKEALRKQVKINALKAAKEKANYLLEAIGEKLGDVLEIHEQEDAYYSPQPMMAQSNMRMMAVSADAGGAADSSLEYQKIKISYRMLVVFRIK